MTDRPARFFRPALRAVLCGSALVLALPIAIAQQPTEDAAGFNTLEWTGRPEVPSIARKEARAALVEGRRECARKGGDRAACLRKVESDYAEMLKRAGSVTTARR